LYGFVRREELFRPPVLSHLGFEKFEEFKIDFDKSRILKGQYKARIGFKFCAYHGPFVYDDSERICIFVDDIIF
jgi:hypothetical protein